MIQGLIDDSESNVEEVIQRVINAHNTSTSQSEENASRSNSALTLSSTALETTILCQKKSLAVGAPIEVCYLFLISS